jgi:hypothetical protein
MVKKPYTAEEKARIVAKGEARLGKQHFFGFGEVAPAVKVLETLEQRVEDAEDKFHAIYTQAFAKAIINLQSSQNLGRV